jgi:hypothetical protein
MSRILYSRPVRSLLLRPILAETYAVPSDKRNVFLTIIPARQSAMAAANVTLRHARIPWRERSKRLRLLGL